MSKNEKNEQARKQFSTRETILLVITALLIGLSIGSLFDNSKKNIRQINLYDEELNEFIKNYNYIIDNYYEKMDRKKLINGAISGMMESLDDPHSVYLDENESNNFSISLNGSYEGIGVQILKEEETGYMIVTSVFKNSPASSSGLMPGDKIISIDGKLSKDLSAIEFSTIVREDKKDAYNMRILRDGEEKEIVLKRSIVTLTSVTSKIYNDGDKKIGYIYIGIFANNTYKQFKEELNKLEKEKIDYLILDVRGNTGGHLTAVDGILKLFLNNKQIMYKFEKNKKTTEIYGTAKENKKYEIILLGDETSASASEVLISGIRENLNSKFIGKKTYGKGTVQELVTLPDGTKYKITIKKWLTPKGNWVNESKGIEPDIEVELDDKYYETYDENDDGQLQRAFEYVRKK